MQIQPYLDRIQHQTPLQPDKTSLDQLHQAHLYHVPFEDLNIQYDIPIMLDLAALYQKVVQKNRGGFCYELNGLFNWLLRGIGFKTRIIAAKVISKEGIIGPVFDHAAIVVDLEKRWLVDVGFGGDSFIRPKELILDVVQKDIHGYYKFTKYSEQEWLLMHGEDGENFKGQYIFTLEAQDLANFRPECHRKQIEEDSHFRKNYICTLARPDGRISIINDKFITKSNGHKKELTIENETERFELLTQQFGIDIADFK